MLIISNISAINQRTTSHEGIKVLVFLLFFFGFFTSILPVDCLVELMWKSLQHSTFSLKFVIFHLCTARAINACLASLSTGSFDMKNVILCIFGINLLYIYQSTDFDETGTKFSYKVLPPLTNKNRSKIAL
jgi:hypothetical protein